MTATPQATPTVAPARGAAAPGSAATPGAPLFGVGYGTAALAVTTALATAGWLVERRRRRQLETAKDSMLWAHAPSIMGATSTSFGLDAVSVLPPVVERPPRKTEAAEIGETRSRREATLIDLHRLAGKLRRLRERGDVAECALLLQEHLVDFRYTSPWVFLELHQLLFELGQVEEWEVARRAFRARFGQNAPPWDAPPTEDAQLADDPQLIDELQRQWPYREARMVVLRWMFGEQEMRQECSGPPLLPLGVYREMMLLDGVLDQVMETRTPMTDSTL